MADSNGDLVSPQLRELLARNSVVFPRDRRAEAEQLAERQPQYWKAIFTAFQTRLDREHSNAVTRLYQAVQKFLESNPAQVNLAGDRYHVVSFVPLVTDEDAEAGVALLQGAPIASLAAILEALAFPLWGNSGDPQLKLHEGMIALLRDPRITAAMVQNIAKRERADFAKKLDDDASAAAGKVEEFLNAARSKEANVNRAIMSILQACQDRQAELINEKDRINKEFDAFIVEARDQILAARKQATESGILLNARSLWRNKARWHAFAFWAGLFSMSIFVGYAIFWVINSGPTFLETLPRKADGEIAYATVAMLTVCVIGAGWLLRFLGRFVTENMVMQSDASQRAVMMRTYLALVGDENAKMDQTDRTLILSAIFRPLPGHQSEDVAPPTLLDMVKSASGKAG